MTAGLTCVDVDLSLKLTLAVFAQMDIVFDSLTVYESKVWKKIFLEVSFLCLGVLIMFLEK